jgi:hypothetical protein
MTRKYNKKNIVKVFSFCSIILYSFFLISIHTEFIKSYTLFYSDSNKPGEFSLFGDLLSVIYSFDNIFSEDTLLKLGVPENWIYYNPYNFPLYGNEIQMIWSQTPLNIIFLIGSGHLANLIGINFLVIFFIYTICMLIFFYKSFKTALKKDLNLLFILFSFPFLFLLERGNILAGIGGIFIYLLFKNFIINDELDSVDLFFFIIACSIRPNYLVFGLLFLFKKDLKFSILEFVKVGTAFIGVNSIFLFFASKLFPGYKFESFVFMVREHTVGTIRFQPWNSSLHGFLHNLFYSSREYFEIIFRQQLILRIEELIIGEGLNNLILIFYIGLLFFAFFNAKKRQLDKISFVAILASVTALSTSPYFNYHLIIFIFLFLVIYDSEISRNISFLQLTLIALILLPKLNSYLPVFNVSTLFNVVFLNLLLFVSIFSKKRIH